MLPFFVFFLGGLEKRVFSPLPVAGGWCFFMVFPFLPLKQNYVMKKLLLSVSISLFLMGQDDCQAQKAGDVLQNGIPVKAGNKIFLRYDGVVLKEAVERTPTDFVTLNDSAIFLVAKEGVNFYMRPMNPLNYSYKGENKVVVDPIDEAAATALGKVTEMVTKLGSALASATTSKQGSTTTGTKGAGANKPTVTKVVDSCAIDFIDMFKQHSTVIQNRLLDDKKKELGKLFKQLKALTFEGEASTIAGLADINTGIGDVDTYFSKTEGLITELLQLAETYACSNPEPFTTQFVLKAVGKELLATTQAQKKRLQNLQTLYKSVKDAQVKGSSEVDGLKWCVALDEVPSTKGKISLYTVTIKESGFHLSDDDEVVATDAKTVLTRTVRVRKFQRFVPEVAAGVAYTFFTYNKYGTVTDDAGQQTVALAGENKVKNMNFTAMVNFNYYIYNSNVHPFWQVGVGANTDIPTLLTGFGLRGVLGTKLISISGGVAMTWIKDLTNLKVGDTVTGTADIEKDLSTQFSWPPKPYVAIQFNF